MIMLLKQLVIKGLYNNYDYDVKFNDDVTFIYGMNGCGKTTVLNITEAIITGRVYRLFEYGFNKITLWYSAGSRKKKQPISVERKDDGLHVAFAEDNAIIRDLLRERELPPDIDFEDIDRIYFSKNPILKNIKDIFNHAYLPLNRSTHFENDNIIFRMQRNMRYQTGNRIVASSQDIVMFKVEELIRRKYSQIMSEIATINDQFRNEILKSLLSVKHGKQNNAIIEVFDELSHLQIEKKEILRIRENYIQILKQLNILKDEEETTYTEFFDDFLSEYERSKGSNGLSLTLASKYLDIQRIKKLVEIAERTEEKKRVVYKPIETFVETINGFLYNEIDDKRIHISTSGEVYFTISDHHSPIRISSLSSGEKQLVIFFASLIFEIQNNSTGIFIVDEPELSLHLSWQAIFIEKALSINNNIQLIFATHAPEIIGKYTDKTFELIKKTCSKENKDEQ